MKLRVLEQKDAPLMLEWMHDESVVFHLGANFAEKTLADCQKFIQISRTDKENLHLAVCDDNDEYMGTVSLKHIDKTAGTAEFAITVRACAMGQGYSLYGMRQILNLGIQELALSAIYWCVSSENTRAVRFYDKCGYTRTQQPPTRILECYTASQREKFLWYVVTEAVS